MPDQTADVQRWIDGTPDGGTLTLGGEYQIDGTLRIWGRKGLTIQGPVLLAARNTYDLTRTDWTTAERNRAQVSIDKQSERITLRDVHVEGSNRTWVSSYDVPGYGLEGQAGFAIGIVHGLELDHCSAEWTFGDAFSVQGGSVKDVGHFPAEDVWVHDSTGRHVGRIGFLHNQVRRAVFERNVLDRVHRPWTHSEPNFGDSVVEDVYIENNDLYGLRLAAYWTGGKPTTVPVRRIVVRGNRGHGVGVSGNFGLPVGTSTVPFPRREHFYWIDNVSDVSTGVTCTEANFVLVRGSPAKLYRCCGVSADQVAAQTACNLTGSYPAPTDVPAMPDPWPYPTGGTVAYATTDQLNAEIWTRAVADKMIVDRLAALESRVAALETAGSVTGAEVDAKIAAAVQALRDDFAS